MYTLQAFFQRLSLLYLQLTTDPCSRQVIHFRDLTVLNYSITKAMDRVMKKKKYVDTKTTNIYGTSMELTISDNIDLVNSLSTQASCNPLSRSHSIIDKTNRTERTAQSHSQIYTSEPN